MTHAEWLCALRQGSLPLLIAAGFVFIIWTFVIDLRAMKKRHRREWDEMRARHFMERFEDECNRIEWEQFKEREL